MHITAFIDDLEMIQIIGGLDWYNVKFFWGIYPNKSSFSWNFHFIFHILLCILAFLLEKQASWFPHKLQSI